ncbi:MAG TPA: hypothetical protein VGM06_01775 [Polyangiaceae bacterium]|jgi:hypothetical protein
MTIERCRGKARPTHVRGSDLRAAEAAAKPTGGRDAHGHFAAGNPIGQGARFTATIRKSLGNKAATGEALIVARDARRVFGHVLPALASDAPPVRALLGIYARHQALHAFFTLKAEAVGLDTPEGLKFLEVADRQSQRAERVLVTCHDLARVHAASAKAAVDPHALLAAIAAEEQST